MGWYAAKAFCEKRGGYLATITTQTENDFVWNNLASQSPNSGGTWLGATNDKTTGAYQWITGEAWNYANWNTGEPNNWEGIIGGGEHYLMMLHSSYGFNGTWNDIAVYNQGTLWGEGYRPISTICEWVGGSSWNF